MQQYGARILADSIGPTGKRLTTFEVTMWREVLAEFNTHRLVSRNSASSRAIPTKKLLEMVRTNPALPVKWGKNVPGMQAPEQLSDVVFDLPLVSDFGPRPSPRAQAKRVWMEARDNAVRIVEELDRIGLHKQIANRLLQPWLFHVVIATATEWDNFFHLRCHPAAQPEMRVVAEYMREAMAASTPKVLRAGDWHLPLVDLGYPGDDCVGGENDIDRAHALLGGGAFDETLKQRLKETLCKVSTGRCARVSYLTHEGKRDLQADIDLCDRLATSGHWSPFEHVAQAMDEWVVCGVDGTPFSAPVSKPGADDIAASIRVEACEVRPARYANLYGWKQYRKHFENEHVGGRLP